MGALALPLLSFSFVLHSPDTTPGAGGRMFNCPQALGVGVGCGQ